MGERHEARIGGGMGEGGEDKRGDGLSHNSESL